MSQTPPPESGPETAAPRRTLPAGAWFLLGALTASAGWYGYGLMQRSMSRSLALAAASLESAAALQSAGPLGQDQAAPGAATDAPPAPSASSLDLVGGLEATRGAPAAAPVIQAQAQAVSDAGLSLFASLKPLLNNPATLNRLSPEQRKRFAELSGMLDAMETSMRQGKRMDAQSQAQYMKIMQDIQNAVGPQAAQERRP